MADVTVNRARLKSLMLKRNVGDGDMAKLSGLSRTTFYYLRTGHHETTSERNLTAIAAALGTTVDYLTAEGDPEDDDGRVAVLLDEPERKLAEVTANLSAIRKEELIRIAEALLAMEREQTELPDTPEAMDALLEVIDMVRAGAGGSDLLAALEALVGNNRGGFLPPSKPVNGPSKPLQSH